MGDITCIKMMDGVWHLMDPAGNGATLVTGKESALLYDTMIGMVDLKGFVETLTDLPIIVVNSHSHLDHIGGNWQFDLAYINFRDLAQWSVNEENISHVEKTLGQKLVYCRKSFALPPRFIDLKDNFLFDLGGLTAQPLSLSGHTEGCMGIYFPEKRLVLVGDAVSPQMCLFMDVTQPLWVFQDTLMMLQQLDFDWFIASHYRRMFPKRLLGKILGATEIVGTKRAVDYTYSMIPKYKAKMYFYEYGNPDTDDGIICILVDKKIALAQRAGQTVAAY